MCVCVRERERERDGGGGERLFKQKSSETERGLERSCRINTQGS